MSWLWQHHQFLTRSAAAPLLLCPETYCSLQTPARISIVILTLPLCPPFRVVVRRVVVSRGQPLIMLVPTRTPNPNPSMHPPPPPGPHLPAPPLPPAPPPLRVVVGGAKPSDAAQLLVVQPVLAPPPHTLTHTQTPHSPPLTPLPPYPPSQGCCWRR